MSQKYTNNYDQGEGHFSQQFCKSQFDFVRQVEQSRSANQGKNHL